MPSSDRPTPGGPQPWHAPERDEERQDAIALLALGETPDPSVDDCVDHVAGCAQCQDDLAALQHVVLLGRHDVGLDRGPGRDERPGPQVWQSIRTELALQEPDQSPVAPPAEHAPPPRWRRAVLAAAAVAAVAVAGTVGGFCLGRQSNPSTSVAATARLDGMPGAPASVSGEATVHSGDSGSLLTVTTDGLPLRSGFYEVWLFDPDRNRMVAVGTLGATGTAQLPVPPGLDIRSYHVVDISAQEYDGNPAHGTSILRGGLTT